ncbi:nucleoside-diphosphate-sugar epimerase [Diplodia corticola]|uniref:Nucleoside-diphosphate-sugar epimerase n=1 Tax=Diplodia corticola TaxID=236234 RepID=A0A1J9RF07_9PEZI|nr:nucleoside-diphosphate-sugar epimerase [Diplodia corticola]OJD38682.1 nucleoside-diphosphate-sugar epimerase [Diplodia corticola]
MAPKIFLTGATGYIGGSVFHTLYTAHPEWTYTVLLRSAPPAAFSALYPAAHVVRGDYDSLETTASAAIAAADVVVHTGNSDHAPSLRALLRVLKAASSSDGAATAKQQTEKKKQTKYLIHLSGTGLLSDFQAPPVPVGSLNPRVYSDRSLADNTDVFIPPPVSEPGSAGWKDPLHGETERIVREAWMREEEEEDEKDGDEAGVRVRTAVVRPPDIYGRGLGVGRKTSAYMPWFVKEILGGGGGGGEEGGEGVGAAFFVGEGQNRRGWVHLLDLMGLYLRLVEKAVEDGEGGGDGPTEAWGREGYYHATTQETSQFELAQAVGRILYEKGLIGEKEPKQVPLDRVDGMLKSVGVPLVGRYMFASNARSAAVRAKDVLGWEPKAPSIWDVLEQDVDDAVKSLGK